MPLLTGCSSSSGSGTSSGDTTDDGSDSNDSGDQTTYSETTELAELTISEGETLGAPDGYSLTMTVDGVETEMVPGTYAGDIVLTVTEEIEVTYGNLDPHYFRTAVYVEDSAYVPEKSVSAAAVGGTVTDVSATDVSITSVGENFNGIIITGNTTYTIVNPVIDFTGNGGNDFAGFGAAIMSSGTADVTVENADVVTDGVVRTAVWVGESSNMTVNDSYLEVNNGTLPADYTFTTTMGEMKEVPWMLGLTGNCRATNLVGSGTATYNNTHIKAQGWGCLSTDDVDSCDLYANGCTIETVESGYGAYSIGDCIDSFSGCTFNVADIGLIMAAQGSGTFTDGTVVNSGRFGVMLHSSGSGTLNINNGSVFNTQSTVIQAKSSTPTIIVDNAQLNSASGIILESISNDDPNMPGSSGSGSVIATFSNMALAGDIVNGNTASSNVIVSFENAAITGAITTASTVSRADIDGVTLSQENYEYIGDVVHTYEATSDTYGMVVTLDKDSTWVVDETSYLTSLTLEAGATLTAPTGTNVAMTVDGTATAIVPGTTYTGNIVLTVSTMRA